MPPTDETVSLQEITKETVYSVLKLQVREDQQNFVATNAQSIAEAYFHEDAWFRAIYADDTPVGFIMLSDIPDKGEYFLWRLMVDEHHQGKDYGRRAVELLIDHVRTRPKAEELYVSYVPGDGSPKEFYEKLGFIDTGKVDHGEVVMKLVL